MKRISGAIATGIALVSLLAACGTAGSAGGHGGDPGVIAHPSNPGQLVLRIDLQGGFTSPDFLATRLPEFSLFGDGTVITEGPTTEIYPGPALPNVLARKLTERGVQKVLQAAARAGLLGQDRSYRTMTVSDMPTTVFTLVTTKKHVVSVYGLGGLSPRMPAAERIARQKLAALEHKLTDLTALLPRGSYSEERRFDPSALRLFVRPYGTVADRSLTEPSAPWPLATPLATFGRPFQNLPGARCGAVRGDDASSVLELARRANQLTPWLSGGHRFGIAFRPLLPDESGC